MGLSAVVRVTLKDGTYHEVSHSLFPHSSIESDC